MEQIDRREILASVVESDVRQYLESLDDPNLLYFSILYGQKKQAHENFTKLSLYDGVGLEPPRGVVVPTAVAPEAWMQSLPHISYKELLNHADEYSKVAKHINLWIKKTQGGGGTAILRKRYLGHLLKAAEKDVELGSKGTDLFVEFLGGHKVSLAEIQIMQSLADLKSRHFPKIFFQNIVSSDTQEAVKNLWKKKCPLSVKHTYEAIHEEFENFVHGGETFQAVLPTLDDKGRLSLNRLAPGGHAFFALDALWAALTEKIPLSPVVAVIGNGEDLGSSPNPAMVGWMVKNKAAIVMITTEKTEIDIKGGQIALSKSDGDYPWVCLIEQAQAKVAGQIELFEKLGLEVRKPGQMALFNTNVALFNYEVLIPKMKKLEEKVGRAELLKIMAPTLIENKKKQTDADGVDRVYEQMEGAMGSTILNLDRAWRKHFREPLVHFINVEREYRTQFFCPVKTSFDFFMQFYSDRFTLNPETFRLDNHRRGSLPSVVLEYSRDPGFYSEVDNVLRIFKNTKIKNLDSLIVKGPMSFEDLTLKGSVQITNKTDEEVKLIEVLPNGAKSLENCSVQISEGMRILITNDKRD